MHHFEIDATNPAQPRVLVDEQEQPALLRASVDLRAGEVPVLFLEYLSHGRFVGSGDVIVQTAGPDAIRAWLATVDPDALEKAALAAEETAGGPLGPGRMFLAGLAALLEAQHG